MRRNDPLFRWMPASMHPLIIIPILNPVVSLERFKRTWPSITVFISWDPQDIISWLQFGHWNRHTAVCWEMWHRCLSASSHGMQACHPEDRGKQQSLVLISVNHKQLKTLGKHAKQLQLRINEFSEAVYDAKNWRHAGQALKKVV